MMRYEFKAIEELLWGAGVSALTYIAQTATAESAPHNWHTWAIALAAGAGRVAGGYLLSHVSATVPTAK